MSRFTISSASRSHLQVMAAKMSTFTIPSICLNRLTGMVVDKKLTTDQTRLAPENETARDKVPHGCSPTDELTRVADAVADAVVVAVQTRKTNQTSNKTECGPCRSLIDQVYLTSQSFSSKLCTRGRVVLTLTSTRKINQTSNKTKCGPCRSLIDQVYLTSQSFSLKLCTRGRVVLTLTSDELTS